MAKKSKKRQAAVSRWISEVMHSYRRKGSIGESGKISEKKAHQMAIAIAFNKVKHKRKKK